MGDVNAEVYRHLEGLPEHRRVLTAVLDYFRSDAVACLVAGSVARGGMDEESDLDVHLVFADHAAREQVWQQRWDWQIAPWFHRFDADHVVPYFVIYLFEPRIKADLPLHTVDEMPTAAGGPYTVAWDDTGRIGPDWVERMVPDETSPDWSAAVHEEERLWAWLVYCLQHVRRGEYYSVAASFPMMRDVVEQWQARLAGRTRFSERRAEQVLDTSELGRLFPAPDHEELKQALLTLIDVHDRQRARLNLPWRTSEPARALIRRWVSEL
jgi:predicted nucleotidyltransferase